LLQGQNAIALALYFASILFILYMAGVAAFRGLRYRLSRTFWHGIRGGSTEKGWRYGGSTLWRYAVGAMALYLMIPWAMMSLWNKRWSQMSFGPWHFTARGDFSKTMGRYMLVFVGFFGTIFGLIGGAVGFMFMSGADFSSARAEDMSPEVLSVLVPIVILIVVGIYVLIPLLILVWYAKFLREAIGNMTLDALHFSFKARTMDWIKLFLGNAALVILTLGIGMIFLSYRNWKFFISHLDATGEVSLSALTQSTTPELTQGEGLLDALDMGAI
jgi:uncharacterized membrane protein YjgN (DUF898 family)